MLFGGNLLRQPAFANLHRTRPHALRLAAELMGSDQIMYSTLFMGTYPGLTQAMLQKELGVIHAFLLGKCSNQPSVAE
jgi:CDP-6-deoxy-D-xylo-4-hexulose-3-dehydrase